MGKTWSSPTNISASLLAAGLTLFAPGPSAGTQSLSTNAVAVPGWYKDKAEGTGATVVVSTDAGATWTFGAKLAGAGNDIPNESTAAYSETGSLVLNMRNSGAARVRLGASSTNDGSSFTAVQELPQLVDPECEGAMVAASDGSLVLSHASSATSRSNGTLSRSDDGNEWSFAAQVGNSGDSYGYSALAELPAYTSGKLTFAVLHEVMSSSGGVASIDVATVTIDGGDAA